eukprot:583899-Pleurochrysis_carterae.AAC.1
MLRARGGGGVRVLRLVTSSTVDEEVLRRQQRKEALDARLLGDGDTGADARARAVARTHMTRTAL